jgi:ribonuclease P protein component
VLYAFPREDGRRTRARASGCPSSRRVGGAVDRTRVKRVLREAFWQEAERLPDGSDYVVVARPERAAWPSARARRRAPRAGELVDGWADRGEAA